MLSFSTNAIQNKLIPVVLSLLFLLEGRAWGAEVKFTPTVALETEYNDNILLTNRDQFDDFIATLSPGLRFEYNTERLTTNFRVKLDGVKYLDLDELDNVDQFYKVFVQYRISPRWSVESEGSFRQDSRPDRDLSSTGLALRPGIRDRWNARLSSGYVFNEKFSGSFSGMLQTETSKDPGFVSSEIGYVGVGGTYNLGKYFQRPTTGRCNFNYTRYNYPDVNSLTENYTLTVGFNREFTEKWSLTMDLGARHTTSDFETLSPIVIELPFPPWFWIVGYETLEMSTSGWGGTGTIDLSYVGEMTNIHFILTQDVSEASGLSGPLERTSLMFTIYKRIRKSYGVYLVTEYFFNNADEDQFQASAEDQKTFRFKPSVNYFLNSRTTLVVGYSYVINMYPETDTEIERHDIMFRVNYNHPLFE